MGICFWLQEQGRESFPNEPKENFETILITLFVLAGLFCWIWKKTYVTAKLSPKKFTLKSQLALISA